MYECILASLFKIYKIYTLRSQDNSRIPGNIEFLIDVLSLKLDLNTDYPYNIHKLSETEHWKLFKNFLDKSKVGLQIHLDRLLVSLTSDYKPIKKIPAQIRMKTE